VHDRVKQREFVELGEHVFVQRRVARGRGRERERAELIAQLRLDVGVLRDPEERPEHGCRRRLMPGEGERRDLYNTSADAQAKQTQDRRASTSASSESRCAALSDKFTRTRSNSRSRTPASALPGAQHEWINGMLYPHRSLVLDSRSSGLALLDQLAPDTVFDQPHFSAMGLRARWDVLRTGQRAIERAARTRSRRGRLPRIWRSALQAYQQGGNERGAKTGEPGDVERRRREGLGWR
jgi:hypothetical protein